MNQSKLSIEQSEDYRAGLRRAAEICTEYASEMRGAHVNTGTSSGALRHRILSETEFWWCNVHKRRATHVGSGPYGKLDRSCNRELGGILMACRCVNLTGIAEIVET